MRVQNASDTKKAHGTSLMERDEGFKQTGLSIGISRRLGKIWEKHQLEEFKDNDMVKENRGRVCESRTCLCIYNIFGRLHILCKHSPDTPFSQQSM